MSMNFSIGRVKLLVAAALLLATGVAPAPARAQGVGGASSALNNAAVLTLFGKNNSFTARVEIKAFDKSNKETTSMPLSFNMLDGKIRMEVDMAEMRSTEQPDPALAYAKQLGMDHLIAIVRPDKKADLIIYPKTSAYAEVPMSPEEIADLDKKYTLATTKVGTEKLNGHSCVKNNVTLTGEKGEKQGFLVWNATDLKDFPVQIQIPSPDNTVVMTFKEVKLVKPEARTFEAPAGLTKYDSAERLVRALTVKIAVEKK